MTDSLLIGRDHPASALRTAVERTAASHGGLVLVTGEAGIGKTALVTGVAAEFRDQMPVAFATSWESEAVPEYWLWTQVLRSLRGQLGEQAWSGLPTDTPAFDVLLGRTEGPLPGEFELYDAVTQLLIAASQRRPLLIVLDDLHFADDGSVELLKFASQHTWFERVLMVATYRDSEVDPGHRLRARLLPLVAKASMVALDGLDDAGIVELIRTTVGTVPDADVVAEIARRTGGNPFFVEQTAQLWAGGQRVDATTAGMRDALQRRLDQLPEHLADMLTLASVGGREFHPAVMAQASGIDVHRIEHVLEEACRTRLVRHGNDRYVFVHDLVRESLYARMSEAEAAGRHSCLVRALVADESLQKLMLLTEIAHHAWLADDSLDAETAVDFMTRAGEQANGCLSPSSAERHFRRALERCTPTMVRRRVLLRLALASTLQMGKRTEEARLLYDKAVIEAEDADDPMLAARVALDLPSSERVDELIRLKTAAYKALSGEAPSTAISHADLTQTLIHQFMRVARERGSDEDLAFGLYTTHAVNWGPGTAAGRQNIVEELGEVARRAGDHDTLLFAASLRWVALLEQGDPAFIAQLDQFTAMAENAESGRWEISVHVDKFVLALMQGRFGDAEQHLDAAATFVGEDPPSLDMVTHLQWELGAARGQADMSSDRRWRSPGDIWHADLLGGLVALHEGDLDAAGRYRTRIDLRADPYGSWQSMWLRFEAEYAAATEDPALISAMRERLAPYEGEWLVAMWGCSVLGPISYWLGMLARAAGAHEQARDHFAAALEQAERFDAGRWSDLARAAAATLAESSESAAPAATVAASEPAGATTTVSATGGARFRREGATWTLAYGDRTVHLPHTKGLADLGRLLERPGEDIAAVDLLDPESGEAVAADARLGGDDVLDAEARARYRDHLERLDEQIDTAAAVGDEPRAVVLDAERQALIEHLRAATGLGGRPRRLGDNAERARKSVSNRIRNALKRIEGVHPELAAHLRAAVTTGTTCAYRPSGEAPARRL